MPAQASGLTRSAVLERARNWVTNKGGYRQSSYYKGYRRDCSGFVSMAWKTGRSYTSSTIRSVAHRVSVKKLKPGDAVRTPGHVAIFVKWRSKSKGLYVAMEESTWGKPALRRVRSLGRGAIGLRYKRLTKPPALVASVPSGAATVTTETSGTIDASTTLQATSTLDAVLATGTISPSEVALVDLPAATPSESVQGATILTRLALVPFYL